MNNPIDLRYSDAIASTLSGPGFEPIAYANRHEEIARKLGFDVSEIVSLTKHVPLCLRGEAHTVGVREFADRIINHTNEPEPPMLKPL